MPPELPLEPAIITRSSQAERPPSRKRPRVPLRATLLAILVGLLTFAFIWLGNAIVEKEPAREQTKPGQAATLIWN